MPVTYGVLMRDGINYSHDTAESISYNNNTSGLTATDVQAAINEINSTKIIPAGGTSSQYLRGDGVWGTPDNTTYGIVTTSDHGLVPSGGTNTKYLRGDGTWQIPPNDTYAVMTSGTTGLAPKGVSGKFLRGDASWETPNNTTYPIVSTTTAGLVPTLNSGATVNYLRGDGSWAKPSNDTYAVATTAKDGLVRSGGTSDKYLRGDGTWQVPPNDDSKISQTATNSGVGDCFVLFTMNGTSASSNGVAATKGEMRYGYNSGDTYLLYDYVRLRFDQVYLDNGTLVLNSQANQKLVFGASNESGYRCFLGVRTSWTFCPYNNNVLRLGNANYRWSKIYANTGTINTSDRNQKKDIVNLDSSAKDFIMDLKPVSYKFKNTNPDIVHDRTHYGLIAQDVEDTMTKMGMTALDFGGFCKDQKMEECRDEDGKGMYNPDGTPVLDSNGLPYRPTKHIPVEGEYVYGLRYEEFIAPIIKTIQIQEDEMQKRKIKIAELKARLDILENK